MNTHHHASDRLRKLREITGSPLGFLSLAAILTAVLAPGCTTDLDDTDDLAGRKYALQSFYSCDSLDAYLTDLGTDLFVSSYLYSYGGYYGGWDRDGGAVPTADDNQSGSENSPESPSDFTTTNVQEAGVDEPDLVKTDGRYIYVVQNSVVHIIESWPTPEDAIELSQVTLDGYGESIFLAGNNLVAFTSIWSYGDVYGGGGERPDDAPAIDPVTNTSNGEEGSGAAEDVEPVQDDFGMNGTRVTIIDITDRSNPSITRTFDVEGNFVNARMVDGKVYLVLMTYLNQVPSEVWTALSEAGLPTVTYDMTLEQRQALEPQVVAIARPIIADYVANGGRDAIIPDFRLDEGARSELFSCTDVMRPANESDLGVLSVIGFDPDESLKPQGVGLLANGWTVYGSQSSLYIAQDSRWWWWGIDAEPYTETHIHQFDLNDGDPSYLASGGVPGWILNQFSMSEYDGHLRIATTDQTTGGWMWGGVGIAETDVATSDDAPSAGSGEASGGAAVEANAEETDEPVDEEPVEEPEEPAEDANNVFVLKANEGLLEVVGSVRGIAPGEQIYAVRFMGDMGYVVTFVQTDPLFVLDLSVPTSPRVVSELIVSGFSTYLHPFDCDGNGDPECLLAIGRDADENGRVLGMHLQLFDVSNPAQPARLHQTVLSMGNAWSWSEAEHDHHAFTFYESRNLLAIPASIEDWEANEHFSGVIAFRVSAADGITEVGRVSHALLAEDMYCGDAGVYSETDCNSWDYPWYAQMRRSVFIDDFMFAISNLGVTSNSVFDWTNILSIIPFF